MIMIRLGLIHRIALLVVAIELAAFGVLGWLYVDRFSDAAESRLASRLHLVSQMIHRNELAVSAISNSQLMGDLLGAPYLDGMVIGSSKRVIAALDPTRLGRRISDVAGFDATRIDEGAPDEQVLSRDGILTTVIHIHDSSNPTPVYYLVLSVSTADLARSKRNISLYGWLASGTLVILSSIAIIIAAQRLISRRIDATLTILQKVERGQIDARIPISEHDELGALQQGINSMTATLGALLEEQRRREHDIREAMESLSVSHAELERFAYVASHDLQEPIRTIVSFTQLLNKRIGETLAQEDRENFNFIVDAAKHMRQLINDLLAFSRVNSRSMPFTGISLTQACRSAVDSLRESIAESEGEVTIGDLPDVQGDLGQMTQVFQNLIGNAIKYQRPGVAPRIAVSAQREGGEWVVSVADNGMGIAASDQDIFEIFRRLHAAGSIPGTGVGLAICRRVVQRHGGRIWYDSVPGEGSVFRFALPITEAAVASV